MERITVITAMILGALGIYSVLVDTFQGGSGGLTARATRCDSTYGDSIYTMATEGKEPFILDMGPGPRSGRLWADVVALCLRRDRRTLAPLRG